MLIFGVFLLTQRERQLGVSRANQMMANIQLAANTLSTSSNYSIPQIVYGQVSTRTSDVQKRNIASTSNHGLPPFVGPKTQPSDRSSPRGRKLSKQSKQTSGYAKAPQESRFHKALNCNVNNIENNSFKNDCSSPATALSNINTSEISFYLTSSISSSSYSLASAKATPPENMIGYSTGNGNRMVGSLPGGIPMGMDYITHENLGFQNLANIWSVGDLSSVSMVATPKVGNLTRISEAVKALSAENLNSGKAEKLKKTSEKNQIEFNIQDLDLPSLDVDSVISLNSAGVGLRTLAKLIYTSSETMSKIFLRYFSNPS
ncbi:hypothetical protein BY996DRAFT_6409610 [Phakopsora pachyrhizi]|nr:hypothetical protein BY996DRAFT_6409610 [Phakopsora pachyrhizi]